MFKIVTCAVVCAFILIYLKSINSEFFAVALLGAGVIITALGIEYLSESINFINKLVANSGIDTAYFSVILKIVGIAYIVEFGAGIIDDLGMKSLSDKLTFVGKAAIFIAAIPIFNAVFNLLLGLI